MKYSTPFNFSTLSSFDDPYAHAEDGMRHIFSAEQFLNRDLLMTLIKRAHAIKQQVELGLEVSTPLRAKQGYRKKSMYALFLDSPSTRTLRSTERAAKLMGFDVVTDHLNGSSMQKGETWEHTIMAHCAMLPDCLAIRANEPEYIERAMRVSSVPIINCGGGHTGEHPTQMLGDQFLIYSRLGRLDNLKIVFVGDLGNCRVTRSNVHMWSSYKNTTIEFFGSPDFPLAKDIRARLDASQATYHVYYDRSKLHEHIATADIVYVIPDIQMTVVADGTQKYKKESDIDSLVMDWKDADVMQDHAIIMHPLPTLGELRPRLDFHPRSVYAPRPGQRDYTNQMTSGVFMRMAALEWAFGYLS